MSIVFVTYCLIISTCNVLFPFNWKIDQGFQGQFGKMNPPSVPWDHGTPTHFPLLRGAWPYNMPQNYMQQGNASYPPNKPFYPQGTRTSMWINSSCSMSLYCLKGFKSQAIMEIPENMNESQSQISTSASSVDEWKSLWEGRVKIEFWNLSQCAACCTSSLFVFAAAGSPGAASASVEIKMIGPWACSEYEEIFVVIHFIWLLYLALWNDLQR